MGADWQVHERLNERFGPRLNVIGGNGVGEVKGACLRRNAEHHARKDPSGGVAQAEVGHEGDQSRLCVQWTEWIKAHAQQRSRDGTFAWATPFPNP